MPSLRPSAPQEGAHWRIKSMQIYKLFATLATHTSISISHQLSTALRHPLSEVFPTPSATTKAQPSSPHAPPTAKEIKPSTSPANPSQDLLQATLPYYQPLPSLPQAPPLSTSPYKQPPYEDCCRKSRPLFVMLRHRTLSSTIYLSEVTHKPFALSRVFLLSSGGKSAVLAKKNAPPRSGILLSMHVVLKTRHANPNILVRRY